MANTRVTPAVPNNGDRPPGEKPVAVGEEVLAWSVGAVAERLDLATSTLRTWDRRYGIGPSQRTGGGHRRYDEVDIQRVRLMAQPDRQGSAGEHGGTGGHLDRCTCPGLRARSGTGRLPPRTPASMSTVEAIVSSAAALDAEGLARLFQRATRESDLVSAWSGVLAPALRRIGERWKDGTMGCRLRAPRQRAAGDRAAVADPQQPCPGRRAS